jgi:hypothetical protein
LRTGANIKKPDVALGGELIVRFKDEEGKNRFKIVSAHIVKKEDDGPYFILTTRMNLLYKPEDSDDVHEALDGFFFL